MARPWRTSASLSVAQRDNALGYPRALFKKRLTLEEYLNARPIADPIRLFDCVMPCAGAEGFLVMRRARAERLGLAYGPELSALNIFQQREPDLHAR
jgi:acetyl-CoA acetyltransferase